MAEVPAVNALMRDAVARYDWSRTTLGPMESWPQSLRTVLGVVMDTPFAMLIMWGPDLIQMYNDGYIPIFGDKHPRSLGQAAQECWADIWNDVGPLLRGVYERGEAVFFENLPLMMQRHGGYQQAYFTFSYSPVREDDTVRGVICVVNETTAHVLREREMAERAEALAEIDRVKTQFFNNVSHEFRTPLTLMLGPLEELARTIPEYELRQSADLARRNALRLQKLVNTLLDFSLVQSGLTERRDTAVDIGVLTADLASEFRSALDHAGLLLHVRVDEGLVALVDQAMYEKIVLNLLSNALKFTFEGGVTVDGSRDGNEYLLRVSDTGTGISESELPHLFERFRRVHGAKSRTHEGSGIGLALVHELVALQSGTITVESVVGAGTTFTVRLPILGDRADAAPAAGDTKLLRQGFREEAESIVRNVTQVAVHREKHAASVLVADDNGDLRTYLSRILSPLYNVTLASDGEEALKAIDEQSPPDLVVLDIMMPRVDGFECARRLRENPRTAAVPVLFLSARAGTEAVADALRHGDEYIVKPFTAADLLARVENLLKRFDERRTSDGERRDLARERTENALLAAVADRFIAAGDTMTVAGAAANVLVPGFADWAVLYEPQSDGVLRALAVRHHSAAKAELGTLVEQRYPYRIGDGSPPASAFASGEALFVPVVTPELYSRAARDREHEAVLGALNLHSMMYLPVKIGTAVAAVLAVVRSENPNPFDERDLVFAQRFAARTALALESVKEYERDRTVALTLQRALLPGALPEVEGLRFSASYTPAAQESLIGGDWYDSFLLPDGRVCLSIGDVVGHGLDAATIMAMLRQALRALAQQTSGPADVLRQLNRLLVGQELGRLATAVVAYFDPVTLQIVVANAGHPYPIVVHEDDSVDTLEAGGMMLGVIQDAEFFETRIRLQPKESFVLHTDGYIENERDAEAGEAKLLRALSRSHQLHDPAPQVHREVLGSDAPRDDAALLIMTVAEFQPKLLVRIPATPEAASMARSTIRRFLAASGLEPSRQADMLVAVGEAVINAIEHAYAGGRGEVLISGHLDENEVEMEIEDFGRWNEAIPEAAQRGYGLPLMHAFARVLAIDKKPGGTRVRLSSRLAASQSELVPEGRLNEALVARDRL